MGIRIWRETQREESNASMLLLLLLSGFECQSDVTAISRDSERGRGRSVALLGRGTYGVQVEDRGRYNLRIRNRICFDGQGADPRAWHGDSGGCSYGLPGRAGGRGGGGGPPPPARGEAGRAQVRGIGMGPPGRARGLPCLVLGSLFLHGSQVVYLLLSVMLVWFYV
jgi:hypothetical protein